jgi:hypothetical protein
MVMVIGTHDGGLDHGHSRGDSWHKGLPHRPSIWEALMSRRNAIIRNLIAAFFALGIVAPIAWMAMDRVPSYTVNSVRIEPQSAIPGQAITIYWEFMVNKSGCDASYGRVLTDANGLKRIYDRFDDTYATLPPGRHKTENVHPFILPIDLPPGPTIMTVLAESSCNWIQRYFWPVYTVSTATFVTLPPSSGR